METMKSNDLRLVAKDPQQMKQCQEQLRTWIAHKVEAVRGELKLIQTNIEATVNAGMETKGLERLERMAVKRIEYYRKIMDALLAGYFIVPNFPMEIFAIRTKAKLPKAEARKGIQEWRFSMPQAQKLPTGAGRYVSTRLGLSKIDEEYWETDEFLPVEFPVALVRPEIIKETGKALEAKIFDQVGIVRDRPNSDPMIIGKIRHPGGNDKEISFLIAWWLDTETYDPLLHAGDQMQESRSSAEIYQTRIL